MGGTERVRPGAELLGQSSRAAASPRGHLLEKRRSRRFLEQHPPAGSAQPIVPGAVGPLLVALPPGRAAGPDRCFPSAGERARPWAPG